MCDMTDWYVWRDWLICVIWLIDMCDMNHWYVWHDSLICVIWLIDMCDMTNWYVWHESLIYVTWLINICDVLIAMQYSCLLVLIVVCVETLMTHVYVWQDLWLICMCDMTHWSVQLPLMCNISKPHMYIYIYIVCIYVYI